MKILHSFEYNTSNYGLCYFTFILRSIKKEHGDCVYFEDCLYLREIDSNDYIKINAKQLEGNYNLS